MKQHGHEELGGILECAVGNVKITVSAVDLTSAKPVERNVRLPEEHIMRSHGDQL